MSIRDLAGLLTGAGAILAVFTLLLFAQPVRAAAACGLASWYGTESCSNPRCLTANGEVFTGRDLTAAHKSLPFGTVLRVVDQASGKAVEVRINDRGPFVAGRSLDLSRAAAAAIGMIHAGVRRVCWERVR